MNQYDIIIIGGGPGGYTAAFELSEMGKKVAIIDKQPIGGVCLNWGCIPTKSLLKHAELYELLNNLDQFGMSAENINFDFSAIQANNQNAKVRLSKGLNYLVKKYQIDFISGTASFVDRNTISINNNDLISGDYIIIATGSSPKKLDYFQGALSAKDIFELPSLPKSITIIGAGAIGVEFAYFFNALGSKVDLIEAQENILPNEDFEVSAWVKKIFQKKGINIFTNENISNTNTECTLVAIGVEGNIKNLNLESVNIRLSSNQHIWVNEHGQTSVENIYAVGDVIGPPWLAHVASAEGSYVAKHISGLEAIPIEYNYIPACTYCKPEIASIGKNEQFLKSQNIFYRVGKVFLNSNGKAVAMNEAEGFIKILVDNQNQILGAHIVGSSATEIISQFSIALSNQLKIEDLIKAIFPHPTISESIHEALLQLK
jgi:dihydrolipoamide dehydrogenase